MQDEDAPFLPRVLLAFAAVGEAWGFHLLAKTESPFRRWIGLGAVAVAVFAGISQLPGMRQGSRWRALLMGLVSLATVALGLLLILGLPGGWSAYLLGVLSVVLALLSLSV